MSFHVGQKVVCVNVRPGPFGFAAVLLTKDREYIISEIYPFEPHGIRVEGVTMFEADRDWFMAARFRPVIERKTETGMAVLRKVAADASKKRETVE